MTARSSTNNEIVMALTIFNMADDSDIEDNNMRVSITNVDFDRAKA